MTTTTRIAPLRSLRKTDKEKAVFFGVSFFLRLVGAQMSFVAPYATLGGKTWWSVLLETNELLGQTHRTPAIWWQAPIRVVLKESGVCVGEARTMDELQTLWTLAGALVEDAKKRTLCNSVSPWLLQELFAAEVSRGEDDKGPPPPPLVSFAVLQQAVDARSWAEAVELLRGSCPAPDWWNARDGVTVLHLACTEGKASLVKNLLAKGADVNAVDNQGWTPLHAACCANSVPCAEMLLDNKDALVMQGTKEGSVALHYLASHQPDASGLWETVASAILSRGCPINVRNHSGETPLMRACFKGRLTVATWLIKKGATVTAECVEMALRGPAPEEMIALLLKKNAVVQQSAHVALATELRVSDKVIEMLQNACKEDEEEFTIIGVPPTSMTDETPCGICGLPLGSAGPPLGCVVCAKVRCGRCIKTFVSASICLTCSAVCSSENNALLSPNQRSELPSPIETLQTSLSGRGSIVSATSTWLWDRIMGAFQGWRSSASLPGAADACARFNLTSGSNVVLLDAWPCSIRGVYFHLFAFNSVLCFALATNETAKAPASPHALDMAIELSEVTFCSAAAPGFVLKLSARRFGDLEVFPCSEPLYWMGNVCCWLWKESRSMTPDIRPERIGMIREPEHAAEVAGLFPQTAGDPFTCTYSAKLSLHGGPSSQGRIYLTRHYLCFTDDQYSPPGTPRDTSEPTLSTPSGGGGSLSKSNNNNTSEDQPTVSAPSPARHRSASSLSTPTTPSRTSGVFSPVSASGGLHQFSIDDSNDNARDSLRLQLNLDEDVSAVEKEDDDSVVIRGLGGVWKLTVPVQMRDSVWDAIRGTVEACSCFNADPHLPKILVVDGLQHFLHAVVVSLIHHSLATLVTVAVFEKERVALFGALGCRVLQFANSEQVAEQAAAFDLVIVGPSSVANHSSFPLAFLSNIAALPSPHPRVLVVAPLLREGNESQNPVVRAASVLVADAVSGCFAPLEICVIRYGPFFQDLFHTSQNLTALGKLHLPVKDRESLLPLVDLADFVECVRTVALFRPPALYFPGSFCISGPKPSPLRALVKMASVVLDRPLHFCCVSKETFSQHYSSGYFDAELIAQWDGLEEASWDSHVEMVAGRLPTAVPQFLYDAKAAVLDQGIPGLMQEVTRRWTTVEAGDLAETSLAGVAEAPPCLPLSVALSRSVSRGGGVSRDSWIATMHLFLGGPDRVGAEWSFWALQEYPQEVIAKDVIAKCLTGMAESWDRVGLRVNPFWSATVLKQLFKDNEESVDLKQWAERLLQKGAMFLHAADCLGDEVASSGPWPTDCDLHSDRLPIVGPGHSEWLTVRYLMLALRKRLAECELLPKKSLSAINSVTPAALNPVVLVLPALGGDAKLRDSASTNNGAASATVSASPGGSSESGEGSAVPPPIASSPHVTLDPSNSWTCTESCPALFKRVRDVSKVAYNDMLRWLGPTQVLTCLFRGRLGGVQEVCSTGGRSGSLFFRSRNGRYLLKTLPPSEEALLVQLMPEYCAHLDRFPDSMLPRYLALMKLQSPSGKSVSFVVMLSVFGAPVDEQYDLKGSKVARKVGGEADSLIARKDLDLKENLKLGSAAKGRIMAILERDSAWLQTRNICDYSLLVGIVRRKEADALEGTDGKTYYYLGIIDTLTVYDLKKRGEHMYKSIALQNSTEISAVDSVRYRLRLLRYLDSIIV